MTSQIRAYLWPVLLMATILTLSGASRIATPDLGFQFSKDKIGHFLVFGLLATSVLRSPALQQRDWKGALVAAGITILFGALDELRQSFTAGRSVEFADWIADTCGAIVAVLAYRCLTPYRQLLEWKVSGRKKQTETGDSDLSHLADRQK